MHADKPKKKVLGVLCMNECVYIYIILLGIHVHK